jgi:hypothetical protein
MSEEIENDEELFTIYICIKNSNNELNSNKFKYEISIGSQKIITEISKNLKLKFNNISRIGSFLTLKLIDESNNSVGSLITNNENGICFSFDCGSGEVLNAFTDLNIKLLDQSRIYSNIDVLLFVWNNSDGDYEDIAFERFDKFIKTF